MTKKTLLSGAAVLGVLMALSLPAGARPLSAIKADGTLRVGLTGDYAPFSLRKPDDKIVGADVTMAESLAKALGVKLQIVHTTWKTLKPDLEADRYDVGMGGISVTADRAAVGDYSVAVSHDGKRPIVRCADKDRYSSLAAIDKPEVKLIVNPGGTNERFAKANLTHAHLEVFPDNKTIFDQVAAGKADVMVTDGAEVDYQSRRHPGVLCSAAVKDSFDHADKAYWMSKDPALKAAVDAWLTKSLAAGDYEKALAAAAKE